jgi:hypothetical protein
MGKSNIEWTTETWNPVIGCAPVSPGCANCYAATMAKRIALMGGPAVERDVAALRDRADMLAGALDDGKRSQKIEELNTVHAQIASATCRCDLCATAKGAR